MSHASMLKARRQHQKTRKLIDAAAKQAKTLAKLALAGPVVKKEKEEGKGQEGKGQDGKSEEGQADQGGAWPAGIEEEHRRRREERRVLALLGPERGGSPRQRRTLPHNCGAPFPDSRRG